MENSQWKSPRQIEEELKVYQRSRFEAYMQMVDEGELPREIGIAAMRDEMDSGLWLPSAGLHGKEVTA